MSEVDNWMLLNFTGVAHNLQRMAIYDILDCCDNIFL